MEERTVSGTLKQRWIIKRQVRVYWDGVTWPQHATLGPRVTAPPGPVIRENPETVIFNR